MNEAPRKVTAGHLGRDAYLYVRQSTVRQVYENTESTRRQYALRERAVALGYARFHSLPNAVQHLKPGVDFALLDAAAAAETDAARRVQTERRALFLRIAAGMAPACAAG